MRNPICYVGGDAFKNIFGSSTASHFGSVSHVINPNSATKRWPYLLGMYCYSEPSGYQENFKTWKAFKSYIKKRHPSASFEIFWKEFEGSFPNAKLMDNEYDMREVLREE